MCIRDSASQININQGSTNILDSEILSQKMCIRDRSEEVKRILDLYSKSNETNVPKDEKKKK